AMGEAGLASRILAGKFGAFGTFASLAGGAESAPGQPTIEELKSLYRWDSLGPATVLYGVIGCPLAHSLSPAIHNAAFAAAGLDAVYVPLLIAPGADNFKRFMDAALSRPWLEMRGLSVTIPHKENALAYVGAENCDQLAQKIGAINTITIGPAGRLRGDNTDYAAAIDALCAAMEIVRGDLAGRAVAVLGAGGAGRAIVAALAHYGADVTIYNRTVSRGRQLAEEFSCRAAALAEAANLEAEIVVNCTSVGMYPQVDAAPLAAIPPSVRVVFDTVYNPIETQLLRKAARAGCKTVSGLDMFVNQAASQFETWTDSSAPREVMQKVVVDRLKHLHH
ncbi:MAG: shikimate dehydrogenase, partial [Phycisphaerae bacterium]|nr:shikimate dehydrogenase [Phycisphaerae bacterium]